MKTAFLLCAGALFLRIPAAASEPLYIAELPNIHEYELFANNGWTGNWYVGYDHCWIAELPPAPEKKKFKKAFLGVKLGRAKTLKQIEALKNAKISALEQELAAAAPEEEKNLREELETLKKQSAENASISISVSDKADFSGRKIYKAAAMSEIPLEGDANEALNGVGESRWFWTEVPMADISSDGPNFVAAWSSNPLFTSVAYAPVIAAGWSKENRYAYLSTDNFGRAPKHPEKKISFFTPALCIKLVPENKQDLRLEITEAVISGGTLRVYAAVEGDPYRLRLRVFDRQEKEIPAGFGISGPPWRLTLHELEKGRYTFYLEAEDRCGNRAASGKKSLAVE